MTTLRLTKKLVNELKVYGDSSPANEVCGALLGNKNSTDTWDCTEFTPLTNVTNSNKEVHYIPDPNEFFQTISRTTHMNKNAKQDLVGIFHTHPHHRPIPSHTDIHGAGYEGVYIIYSPKYKSMEAYYYNGVDRDFIPTSITTESF